MALSYWLKYMYINSKQINCSSNIENKSKLEESLKLYKKIKVILIKDSDNVIYTKSRMVRSII